MSIRILETMLPGVGRRYDMYLRDDRVLTVVALDRGGVELSMARAGDDEPSASLPLTEAEAVAVAALLTGAEFSVRHDPTALTVEAITMPETARRLAEEVASLDGVSVVAVIRENEEILGALEVDEFRPGDRVVVAGPSASLAHLQQRLG
ncbi:MAG: potassium transporter TrkA [Acidimicrobiia bacterium]|nr:MAG: potassium transporter TrkA [Acidimicrobiia bacterium]